jgi:hypothetical protein
MLPTPSILHNKNPFIGQYTNWLSSEDLDIIHNKNIAAVPARVRRQGILVEDHRIRKAKNHRIELGADLYFDSLADRIVKLFELQDPLQLEPLVFIEYATGNYFHEHSDLTSGFSSQRTHTVLMYLNDNFTGGDTYFNSLGLRVSPIQGSALIFEYNAENPVNHSGLNVSSGTKQIIAAFIRDKPFSLEDRALVRY